VKYDIGEFYMNICREIPNFVKIGQHYWEIYIKI